MKGRTIVIATLLSLGALVAIGAVGLNYAASRNGPAVLSQIDRFVAGARGAQVKATIQTGAHPQQRLIVWGPEERDPGAVPLPVLLFSHGGGWENGNPQDYGVVGRQFVGEGFIVVLAGYRLGPDGIYPAMLEDTARAIAWTAEEIAAYGGDPERIVVAGHSAGAYNVVMATLEEQWLGRRGLSPDAVAGVIGLAGPYEFVPLKSDYTRAAFGHVERLDATQPLEHIRGDGPPVLLIHGDADATAGIHNSRSLESGLRGAGGRVSTLYLPGIDHIEPIKALAAPWRWREPLGSIPAAMADFARDPAGYAPDFDAQAAQTSVPVKPERR